MRPEDGSDWLVGGEPWPGDNPLLVIPSAWHDFVRVWAACRGEAGIAHWPDAGGLNDQAAWIVEGFALLSSLAAQRDEVRRRGQQVS